jgi:quercetin dioxygenase-like cupin family protein
MILLTSLALFLMGCESGPMSAMNDSSKGSHQLVTAEQVKWEAAPPSLPAGAKLAALDGDPAKPGFFTMRLWMPDGYRIQPHYHPNYERVTVLSGTLYLGEGDRFDESVAKPLPTGSYSSMPPGMHHFGYAKGETVLQLSTIGPWGITYINPADDPRKQGK